MLQLQTEGTPLLQRVAPGHVTDFIIDLCYGLVSAMTNARGAVSVPLHVDEEAWELGLQADAKQVRISAYCPGPIATVAAFERSIAVEALANTLRSTAERLLQADFCTLTARSSLQSALEQLAQLPKDSLSRLGDGDLLASLRLAAGLLGQLGQLFQRTLQARARGQGAKVGL